MPVSKVRAFTAEGCGTGCLARARLKLEKLHFRPICYFIIAVYVLSAVSNLIVLIVHRCQYLKTSQKLSYYRLAGLVANYLSLFSLIVLLIPEVIILIWIVNTDGFKFIFTPANLSLGLMILLTLTCVMLTLQANKNITKCPKITPKRERLVFVATIISILLTLILWICLNLVEEFILIILL